MRYQASCDLIPNWLLLSHLLLIDFFFLTNLACCVSIGFHVRLRKEEGNIKKVLEGGRICSTLKEDLQDANSSPSYSGFLS